MFRYGGSYFHDVLGVCEDTFYATKLHNPTLEKGGQNMIGDVAAIESGMSGYGALIFAQSEYVEQSIQMLDLVYLRGGAPSTPTGAGKACTLSTTKRATPITCLG